MRGHLQAARHPRHPDGTNGHLVLLALKLLLVPALVGSVTLAARRWGLRVAGLLTALPLVAGPTLVFYAIEQGNAFAADAGRAAMLGICGTAAFCLAYARASARANCVASLLAALAAFAAVASGVHRLDFGGIGELSIAIASLLAAHRLLPAPAGLPASSLPPAWDLPVRMIAAATVVGVLTGIAHLAGSAISGVLSAFPAVTLVLAVFTHAQRGHASVAALVSGVLRGLHGFALFCIIFSTALAHLQWALFPAVLAALGTQLLFQMVALAVMARRSGAASARAQFPAAPADS